MKLAQACVSVQMLSRGFLVIFGSYKNTFKLKET